MSSLTTVLQLSDDNALPQEEVREMLREIRKDTEQMQSTLDNLLNWSLMQMGMSHYEPEPVHLKPFLENILVMYLPLMKKKEIGSSILCSDAVWILADSNQLSLIVRNLVDNAVKFTPLHGSITVGLQHENGASRVYVANSGKGIGAEVVARILGSDQVGSSYGTANEKGTGLGLQLCKEFIRNMGSGLEIASVKNKKTVFSFVVKEAEPPAADSRQAG